MEFCNGDRGAASTQPLCALPRVQLALEGTLLCTTAERLLHSLAELLGEDGVEKWVAAGVNGKD